MRPLDPEGHEVRRPNAHGLHATPPPIGDLALRALHPRPGRRDRGEDEAQWKSHNYNHLMEQPTIFYAIAITLALMDMDGGINYWLAWGYVGFRVLHSLVQATVNVIAYRLPIFLLATLCLGGLTVQAGLRVLHDCGLI